MTTSIEVTIDHSGLTWVMVKLRTQQSNYMYKVFVPSDMLDREVIPIIVEEAKRAFMQCIFADVTPVITEIRTCPDAGCPSGDQEAAR